MVWSKMNTSVYSSFTELKRGVSGYSFTGHAILMMLIFVVTMASSMFLLV